MTSSCSQAAARSPVHFRRLGGAPISGVNVNVYSYPAFQFLANGLTNSSGFYSVGVNASTVYLELFRAGPAGIAPTSSWNVAKTNLSVGSGVVYNVDLPLATLTGNVTDAGGNPVAAGTITSSSSATGPAQTSWFAQGSAGTSATGAYSLLIFAGTVEFTVRPQREVRSRFWSIATLSSPETPRGTLCCRPPRRCPASCEDRAGQAVPAVTVTARSTINSATLATATTATDGSYLLNLPPGNVNLTFARSGPVGISPNSSWSVNRNNIAVAGATTLDLQLPVVAVSGQTNAASGAPLGGATITADSSGSDAQGGWSSNASVTTSAAPAGAYSLLLFKGTANFAVRPPNGTTSAALIDRGVPLTVDLVRDFNLPLAITLSGIVRGVGGQPVPGANVIARHTSFVTIGSATTDTNGFYSIAVPAGTLGEVNFSRGSVQPMAPTFWNFRRVSFPIVGPTTLDVTLNVIRVNGTAVDSNGAPIPNVLIQASNSRPQTGGDLTDWNSSISINTNAAGAYSALVLTGTGRLRFGRRPTAASLRRP